MESSSNSVPTDDAANPNYSEMRSFHSDMMDSKENAPVTHSFGDIAMQPHQDGFMPINCERLSPHDDITSHSSDEDIGHGQVRPAGGSENTVCSEVEDCANGFSSVNHDETGESFAAALVKKFDRDDDQRLEFTIEFKVVESKTKTLPRRSESGDLVIPHVLSLSMCKISHAGQLSSIGHLIENVRELDLSINYLKDWNEIFEILLHLPKLCFVNLSSNPLVPLNLSAIGRRPQPIMHTVLSSSSSSDSSIAEFCTEQSLDAPVSDPSDVRSADPALLNLDRLESKLIDNQKSETAEKSEAFLSLKLDDADDRNMHITQNVVEEADAIHDFAVKWNNSKLSDLPTNGTLLILSYDGRIKNTERETESRGIEKSESGEEGCDMVCGNSENVGSDQDKNEATCPDCNREDASRANDDGTSDIVMDQSGACGGVVCLRGAHGADEGQCDGGDTVLNEATLIRFNNITQLVLNATNVTWTTVLGLLVIMPNVTELHLSLNRFSFIDIPAESRRHPKVNTIHINDNHIARWTEVDKLGRVFPNTISLIMMDNPLNGFSDCPDCGAQFGALKSLVLTRTLIESWTELELLNLFPALTDVKVIGIPFLQSIEEKLRRKLVIAYLPNITRLNGSVVSAHEREDAERTFMREHLHAADKPDRYRQLEQKHGTVNALASINLRASSYVTVTVKYGDLSVLKQLDVHWSALQLKQRLARELVHSAPATFIMYHVDVGSPFGDSLMSFPKRSLLNYRVKDGDEILCCLK